jgi:hypothetical protein
MSTKGVAVIPEIRPGKTSASCISGNQDVSGRGCGVSCVGGGGRPAGHGQAATVASAWTGQALTVAALPRPARYPCEPESRR